MQVSKKGTLARLTGQTISRRLGSAPSARRCMRVPRMQASLVVVVLALQVRASEQRAVGRHKPLAQLLTRPPGRWV